MLFRACQQPGGQFHLVTSIPDPLKGTSSTMPAGANISILYLLL